MSNSALTINDSNGAVPTVLGNKPDAVTRIATGGKIRAGIKVLTKKAAEHPQVKQIYEQGVAAGESFEQIEKQLSEALPNLKTSLVPKNVQWFTVRGQDYPNPRIADQILDTYGEDRGDGIKRLYRFLVVCPSDIWQSVMPHELAAWGANERRYWSKYSQTCYASISRLLFHRSEEDGHVAIGMVNYMATLYSSGISVFFWSAVHFTEHGNLACIIRN